MQNEIIFLVLDSPEGGFEAHVGTLNPVLNDVASHLGIGKDELIRRIS